MKRWVKYTIAGLVIAAVIGGIVLARRGGKEEARTVRAERGDVKQEVSFTGKLKAQQEVALGFELGGTIQEVAVELGESVEKGQVLARVDSRLASLELAKAKADEVAAQAQKYAALQTAEADLSKTKAENARALETQRQTVRNAKAELDQQRNVVNRTDTENGQSALTETSILSLRVKESAYVSAQKTLLELEKTVEKSNTLKQQAALEAKAAVASVESFRAGRKLASVKLSKTVITAPFAGVITAREIEAGEYIAPGTLALRLATVDALEISADVPETDAAKLVAGQSAMVTFDAYGSSESWNGEVVSVAPSARMIEGVPTFEVKLQLISSDSKFKPGLTANIVVHAAEKKDVVTLPRRAVINRDGKEFVKLVDRDVEVKTGLLGSDGRIEIISGLSGGEEIIISNGSAGN